MTDTRTAQLLADLDTAEQAHSRAFALARRLLADQQPDRPILNVKVHHLYGEVVQVQVNTAGWLDTPTGESGNAIAAWATVLDSPVKSLPLSKDGRTADVLHCYANGVLDDTRVEVWACVVVPITGVVVTRLRKRRRITYQQGAETYTHLVEDQDAADRWIKNNVRTAVTV